MSFLKIIKYLFIFLLTFLLGAQTTHAKTEVILPQKQVVFTVLQNQKVSPLKKVVPPNVGFLKEKIKFVTIQRISAVNSCNFSESFVGSLAEAGGDFLEEVISSIPAGQRNLYHTNAGRFAPYDEAFDVSLVKLNSSEEYVRVFNYKPNGIDNNKASFWFMRKKDITKADGSLMSAAEIKDKFALPEAPTHYTKVQTSANTEAYRGIAKEQIQEGWGNGGGIQYEFNGSYNENWFVGEFAF